MVFWSAEERLRREAARWFGRMRGSNAFRYNSAFKAWLRKDPRHRATYQRLVTRWDASYLLTSSDTIVPAQPSLPTPTSRIARPAGLALAAAVLAVGLLALGLFLRAEPRPSDPVVASAIGQRRALTLVDGSRLILDADSAVAPLITAHARTVSLLRGRVRFRVAAAATPFVVLAGDALITARGTEFDVDRVTADRIDVVLMRGMVDISRRTRFDLLGPVRWIRLTGRQRLSLRGPRAQLAQAAPLASTADWTTGPLSFDDAPLGDALVEANRYSVRKIRLGSPDLARLEITGVFDTDASEDLAQGLARALGLSLETAPNGDLVLSRHAA